MKKLLIFGLLMFVFVNAFSQKKEEMVQKLTQLETAVGELQNENKQLKADITNLQGSVKVATDANTLLENKIKFLEDVNKTQTESIQQLKKDISELKKSDPHAIITDPQNEEDSIICVVQQYFGAKKWEDILPYVYKPDKVRPLMQNFYTSGYPKKPLVDKNIIAIPGSNYKVGDKFIVNISDGILYFRKTTEGFKVDWEASVCYNEEDYRSYEAREGTNKIVVRVNLRNFESNDLWDSYGLAGKYYSLNGYFYLLKNSDAGKRIAERFKTNSNGIRIMVEIQGKQISDGYDSRYFMFITRIVQEDWFSE